MSKHDPIIFACGLIAGLLALASTSEAATWFVGPDGTGTNHPAAGTNAALPFATLAYTLAQASDGDTIHLLAGSHTQIAPIDIGTELTFEGEGPGVSRIYFPSNFTAAQNVHAFSIYAAHVTFQDLTIERQNFLPFGAVINLAGVDDFTPGYFDDFTMRRVELIGGSRALLLNPANMLMEDCVIRGLDAASNQDYGQDALALEIVGFSGTVSVIHTYIDGALVGNLGGTHIRRAIQVEPRGGGIHCAGTLRMISNIIFNVREPFLWDHYINPLAEEASVQFIHNTVDLTEKTPFTFFANGSGPGGSEYLKFTNVVLRDNLFARLGGTAVGRSDYQADNFAHNFPIGGFLFENNLLFIHPATAPVDALWHPLSTDPGWFGGAEFNTNAQSPALRFDMFSDASPFADPAHSNRNFSLNPLTSAGWLALGGATDGGNLGAWPMPAPTVYIGPGSNVVIAWATLSNFTYHVEHREAMDTGEWSTLGAPVTGTGGWQSVVDAGAPASKFYRVTVEQ